MKATNENKTLLRHGQKKLNKIYFTVAMLFSVGYSCSVNGQMTVSEGTLFSGSADGQLTLDSSLVNQGEMTFQDQFTVTLNGDGVVMSSQALNVSNLQMRGSMYEVDGTLNVDDSLFLVNGIITPLASSKITVKDGGGATSENQAHVDGHLFMEGLGMKFYPIGTNGIYTPVVLENVEGDPDVVVGLTANNFDLGITDMIENVDPSIDWFWTMDVDGEYSGSQVRLPLLSEDLELLTENEGKPVVVQSDGPGLDTENLNSEFMDGDSTVVSLESANRTFVLVGNALEIDPVIHNIITTGGDLQNPFLIIENIDGLAGNEVTLIDRWGNVVFQEKDFRNYNQTDNEYSGEFDGLPSGNYVCIVKFSGESISQVVTVLKE